MDSSQPASALAAVSYAANAQTAAPAPAPNSAPNSALASTSKPPVATSAIPAAAVPPASIAVQPSATPASNTTAIAIATTNTKTITAPATITDTTTNSTPPPPSAAASRPDEPSSYQRPIRRRMRMITSCFECRRRKLKCNKGQPCENCVRFTRECVYLANRLDDAGKMRFNELKEKVGSLERAMERDIILSNSTRKVNLLADAVGFNDTHDSAIQPGDMIMAETVLPNRRSIPTDDVVDVVLRVGCAHLHVRTEALLLASFNSDNVPIHDLIDLINAETRTYDPFPDFLRFSSDCLMPFSMCTNGDFPANASLNPLLPQRPVANILVARYFRAVHLVCPCFDQKEFQIQYMIFWDRIVQGITPSDKAFCAVFSVLFSAVVSMRDNEYYAAVGRERSVDIKRLQMGVEIALHRAQYMRGTNFSTLQALVAYLLAICRTEISRAHSAAVGTALRIAEFMGLGKDGQFFDLTPKEIQLRRLIWYQLCFLDIRTSEAQGPRPYVCREDFNTKLPINVSDEVLHSSSKMPEPTNCWTPILLSILRFEIIEMTRAVWDDRQKPEGRRHTITEMLNRIEDFRKMMIDKYDKLMDNNDPVQRYTKVAFHLQVYRLFVLVLVRYHQPSVNELPQKLNSVLIHAAIMIVELTITLETHPEYTDWRWYIGAYTQYQPALILAREIFDNPNSLDRDRIWACLDFVFNLRPEDDRNFKIRCIMASVISKLRVYRTLRMPRWGTSGKHHHKYEQVEHAAAPSATADPAHSELSSTASAPSVVPPQAMMHGGNTLAASWVLPKKSPSPATLMDMDGSHAPHYAGSPMKVGTPQSYGSDDLLGPESWQRALNPAPLFVGQPAQ
ncbi:hypothetical protein TD95_001183, partial [Thielaviopsis punctulata]